MSRCVIKSRKGKVKLTYENIFDFSFNDSKECFFESVRNEIKCMLKHESEIFISKLKLKINEFSYTFLTNCEKCRELKDSEGIKSIHQEYKSRINSDDFCNIFQMILNANNNNNKNSSHPISSKKNYQNTNTNFNDRLSAPTFNLNSTNSLNDFKEDTKKARNIVNPILIYNHDQILYDILKSSENEKEKDIFDIKM